MSFFKKKGQPHTDFKSKEFSGTTSTPSKPSYENKHIVTFEPRSYSEVQFVADNLKTGKASIVNLSRLPIDEVRRVTDFLSGVIYTIDGTVKKLETKMYLFTPSKVSVGEHIS